MKLVRARSLKEGSSRSCGCLAAEIQRNRITKYPEWPTRTGASSYVVEKDGKKQTLKEWSKELDISLPVLITRWNRGWPDDRLLNPTANQLERRFAMPEELEKEQEGEE